AGVWGCARILRLLAQYMDLLRDWVEKRDAKFGRASHKPFGRAISPDDARIVEIARLLGERATLRGSDVAKHDRITGRLRRACARAAQRPAADVPIVSDPPPQGGDWGSTGAV